MKQPTYCYAEYAAAGKGTAGKILVFLAVLLLFLPCAVSGFGLGVAPMTTEVEVRAGSFSRKVVKVSNGGRRNLQLTIGTADWKMDENGELVLNPPDSTPRSATPWFNFSPAGLLLKSGETKQVVVDIQVPRKIEGPGDYRAALLVKTMLPPNAGQTDTKSVWNLYEIASLFYVIVNPVKPDTRIASAFLKESAPDGPHILLDFENSGSRHDRVRGEFRFTGPDQKPAGALKVEDVVVLDHQNLKRKFFIQNTISALPPGLFTIHAELVNAKGNPVPGFPDMQLKLPLSDKTEEKPRAPKP